MLGGSAPSQASGAPFRTESESRTTVWPPPAHQNNVFNRGYNIYSLFPGPSDNAKTLYTPVAKATTQSGNSFQGFLDTQKANVSSPYDSKTNPIATDPGKSQINLMAKTFDHSPDNYYKIENSKEGEVNSKNQKRFEGSDYVVIKREVLECNKIQEGGEGERNVKDDNNDGDNGGGVEKEKGDCNIIKRNEMLRTEGNDDNDSANVQSVNTNEPDSTESRISNENCKYNEGMELRDDF
ncbi:hypothetical protein Phum_PHUM234980 [Pediculus humanus corporis]|uniref:Uncharacterized protein n=1 Tax=Pediculus humanus subsp. corporis TaxID=121224 RepID=E0VIX3_PEDHC|nr:uncharacterized protein Phum_PHUM234980 [Pediculus humanus corporis]EEB13329.1 hypothetical protein Phum_PHUM234980 [Pediculus humanus corporis]